MGSYYIQGDVPKGGAAAMMWRIGMKKGQECEKLDGIIEINGELEPIESITIMDGKMIIEAASGETRVFKIEAVK